MLTYIRNSYQTIISQGGLEADDEMGIYQLEATREGRDTTICSRDKDLRIIPGYHYSWECGKQTAIGPEYTDELGRLGKRENGSVLGYGTLFFYYQMLVGDSADNIPGLPRYGTVAAYNTLEGCESIQDAYRRVRDLYKEKLGDDAKDYFLEQADLLWIRQDRDRGYELPKKT